MTQAGEKGSVADLDLDALRWKNRVLVLFSPSESDVSFQLQKQGLASSTEGVLDRELMVLEIMEQKDGGVKLRSSEPVSTKDLFGLIDSMPMRRQEMESKKE